MLAHFIQHKGKGLWVILLPLFLGILLATLADFLSYGSNYVGATAFLLSGLILFFIDNKRPTTTVGVIVQKVVKLPRVKRKNTLMWIEVRYWAILLAGIGVVWLFNIK